MTRHFRSRRDVTPHEVRALTIPIVLHRVVNGPQSAFEDIQHDTFLSIARHISGHSVTIEQHTSSRVGDLRRWLLTFDDGHASDYEIVFPALESADLRAVFFLITSRIGTPGYLSWNQAREMHKHGMEFGSHSMTHVRMSTLNNADAQKELLQSRLEIEDKLGCAVCAFAFPYGTFSANLIQLTLDAGYKACCTSDHGIVELPAPVIPRNSINGAMRWPAILRTLEPSLRVRIAWAMEDWLKCGVRQIIGDRAYRTTRGLIART